MPPKSQKAKQSSLSLTSDSSSDVFTRTNIITPNNAGAEKDQNAYYLSAATLQSIPENQLIAFLFKAHKIVRVLAALPLTEGPAGKSKKNAVEGSQSLLLAPDYIKALLSLSLSHSSDTDNNHDSAKTSATVSATANNINSSSTNANDVQILVGCILCDALRLYSLNNVQSKISLFPQSNSTKAMESCVISSPKELAEVLRILSASFTALVKNSSSNNNNNNNSSSSRISINFSSLSSLIERISICKAIPILLASPLYLQLMSNEGRNHQLEKLRESIQESYLTSFFKVIPLLGGNANTKNSTANSSGSNKNSAMGQSGISAVSASEFASILVDIINSTHFITEEQLNPLINEVVAHSPTLNSNNKENVGAPSLIASKVMIAKGEEVREIIHNTVTELVKEGVAEVNLGEVVGNNNNNNNNNNSNAVSEEKKKGLKLISRAMSIFVALCELSPVTFGNVLLSSLYSFISSNSSGGVGGDGGNEELHHHDSVACGSDVRLLLLRGFSSAFKCNEEMIKYYPKYFDFLISYFGNLTNSNNSEKLGLKIECIPLLTENVLLRSNGNNNNNNNNNNNSDDQTTSVFSDATALRFFQKHMSLFLSVKLTDPQVLIRKQAVTSYGRLLLSLPAAVVIAILDSNVVAESLGLRLADKNAKVRETAMHYLTRVYQKFCFLTNVCWIPQYFFKSINLENSSKMVELSLDTLLPDNSKANCGGNSSGRTSGNSKVVLQSLFSSGRSSGSGAVANSNLLFDFEKEALGKEMGIVDGFIRLCHDLNSNTSSGSVFFSHLLSFARKKCQLRKAVLKLFELRAEIKKADDPKSPEGTKIIEDIHRLLVFLQSVTRTNKKEWDSLFRSRDDAVAKAFMRFCSLDSVSSTSSGGSGSGNTSINWKFERAKFLSDLKGRVDTDVYKFISEELVVYLSFPFETQSLEELLALIRDELPKVSTSKSGSGGGDVSTLLPLLQTLHFMCTYSPFYLVKSTNVVEVLLSALDAVVSLDSSGSRASPVENSWAFLVFQMLIEWANSEEDASSANKAAFDKVFTKQRKHSLLMTLGQICTGNSPVMSIGAEEEKNAILDYRFYGRLSKLSAKTILSLIGNSHFTTEVKVLSSLIQTLSSVINRATTIGKAEEGEEREKDDEDENEEDDGDADKTTAAAGTSKGKAQMAGKMKQRKEKKSKTAEDSITAVLAVKVVAASSCLRAFAKSKVSSILLSSSSNNLLMDDCISLFDIHIARSGNARGKAATQNQENTKLKDYIALLQEQPIALRTSRSLNANYTSTGGFRIDYYFASPSIAITDAALKLTNALLFHCFSADRFSSSSSFFMERLLQGYKKIQNAAGAVGGIQRRVAVHKQLVKLLRVAGNDISKELVSAILLSAEEHASAREIVQEKMKLHILNQKQRGIKIDMRFVSFLVMTAVSEENRAGYTNLKRTFSQVGDYLRNEINTINSNVSSGTVVSLSSPNAFHYYLEYCLPFVILFLSHHTFFEAERTSNNFMGFQRVFFLLFEELFRLSFQSLTFLNELIARIKISTDVLTAGANKQGVGNNKILCDLASKVMQSVQGQKEQVLSSEVNKRFPGSILMPSFFVADNNNVEGNNAILTTVFLDHSIHVGASAPFRLVNTHHHHNNNNANPTPSQSVARDAQQQVNENESENEEEMEYLNNGGGGVGEGLNEGALPNPLKRSRSRSVPQSSRAAVGAASHNNYNNKAEVEEEEARAPANTPAAKKARTEDLSSSNHLAVGSNNIILMKRVVLQFVQNKTKSQIAQIKWKDIKASLLDSISSIRSKEEEKRLLELAKEELTVRYNEAK